MDAGELTKLFGIAHDVLERTLEGISHEDSLRQPQSQGNCLNWVLGHIVATRDGALELVGEERLWTEAEARPYARGSAPLRDASLAHRLEELRADLQRSQERLVAGLGRLRADASSATAGDATVGDALAILHFHEAYHTGQIALLRRMVGREGVIRQELRAMRPVVS